MASSFSYPSKLRSFSAALAVVGLVVGGEYFFRHYVLFWLPVVGTLTVNDMLSLFLAYWLLSASLGLLAHVRWQEELAGIARSLREGLASWNFTRYVLGLVLSVWALSFVDRLLWGNIALPMVVSAYRNPAVLLPHLAPVLAVLSLVLVNGFFVPIAEEFLWRGLVQGRLVRVFPAPFAIGLTAVLFSLKHVLVDASLGRFLALTAFGAICGLAAHRSNWRRSAALHIVVNTIATLAGLAFTPG